MPCSRRTMRSNCCLPSGPSRHDEPAAHRQLLDQLLGNDQRRGRDENAVKRRLRAPADRTIAYLEAHVAYAEFLQAQARTRLQAPRCARWCKCARPAAPAPRSGSRSRCRPRATCRAAALEQRLAHARHDVGLRDRLPEADRQRGILVGAAGDRLVDKDMPRQVADAVQHGQVGDALIAQALHQAIASAAPKSCRCRRSVGRSWR